MSGRIGFDPATANHQTAQFRLGETFEQEGKRYKYVQFKEVDVVAIAAGMPLKWVDTDQTQVTTDVSAALGGTTAPVAGVAIHAPTNDYYGFMLFEGEYTGTYVTDGTASAGSGLVCDTDGEWTIALAAMVIPINCWAHTTDAALVGTGLSIRS